MPPKYLSVEGHRACLSSHTSNPQDTFKSICIPNSQPPTCFAESWSKLKEMAGNGIIEACNNEEIQGKISIKILRVSL